MDYNIYPKYVFLIYLRDFLSGVTICLAGAMHDLISITKQ